MRIHTSNQPEQGAKTFENIDQWFRNRQSNRQRFQSWPVGALTAISSCAAGRSSCKLCTNCGEIARDELMKAVNESNAFVYSVAIAFSLFAIGAVADQSRQSIELNETAYTFAMELIK